MAGENGVIRAGSFPGIHLSGEALNVGQILLHRGGGHPHIAGADGVAGEDVVVAVEEDHGALGMAGDFKDFQLAAAGGDGVPILDVGDVVQVDVISGHHGRGVQLVDIQLAQLAGRSQRGQAQDVVAVVVGQHHVDGLLLGHQAVLHQIAIQVRLAIAAHGGVDEDGVLAGAGVDDIDLAQLIIPDGGNAQLLRDRLGGEGHGGVDGTVLGLFQRLGEEPVVRRADAVDPVGQIPVGVGGNGTSGVDLVLGAGAAVGLEGGDHVAGVGFGGGLVVGGVEGPDGLILQRGQRVGIGQQLRGDAAADGHGSGEDVGVSRDHLPDGGAAHGHALDIDPVGVHIGVILHKVIQQSLHLRHIPAVGVGVLRRQDVGGVLGLVGGLGPQGSALAVQLGQVIAAGFLLAVEEENQRIGSAGLALLRLKIAVVHALVGAGLELVGHVFADSGSADVPIGQALGGHLGLHVELIPAVGQLGTEGGLAVGKVHEAAVILVGAALPAVARVAGLDKVGPAAGHHVGQSMVGLGPGPLTGYVVPHGIEHVPQVGGMEGAIEALVPVDDGAVIVGGEHLVEVIDIGAVQVLGAGGHGLEHIDAVADQPLFAADAHIHAVSLGGVVHLVVGQGKEGVGVILLVQVAPLALQVGIERIGIQGAVGLAA